MAPSRFLERALRPCYKRAHSGLSGVRFNADVLENQGYVCCLNGDKFLLRTRPFYPKLGLTNKATRYGPIYEQAGKNMCHGSSLQL